MASYSIDPPPPVPSNRDRKQRKVFTPSQKNSTETPPDSLQDKSPILISLDNVESSCKFSSDLEGLDLNCATLGSGTLKKGLSNSLEDLSATNKTYPDISGLFYELRPKGYASNMTAPSIGFSHFTNPTYFDRPVPLMQPSVTQSVEPHTTIPPSTQLQQQKPSCPFSPPNYQNAPIFTPFQYPSPALVTTSHPVQVPSPLPWTAVPPVLFKEKFSSSNMHRPASLNDLDEIDVYPKVLPVTSASAVSTPITDTLGMEYSQTDSTSHSPINLIDLSEREYLNLADFDPYRVEQHLCPSASFPQELSTAVSSKDNKMGRSASEDDMLNCTSLLLKWSEVPAANNFSQATEKDDLSKCMSLLQGWSETSDVASAMSDSVDATQSPDYVNSIVETSKPEIPNRCFKGDNKPLDTIVPLQHYPSKKTKDFCKWDIPPKSTSRTFLRKEASYEKLRNEAFVDEEFESFRKTVTELKKKYKSVDHVTNLGFIVSPVCNFRNEAKSIKVVVHAKKQMEAIEFTCDINTLVEHVIYQCIFNERCSLNNTGTSDYILKVFDRSEYLLNHLELSRYEYVHSCLKMNTDIRFQLMRLQDISRKLQRTEQDDRQLLNYPRYCIQGRNKGELTRDGLEILMETFYKEIERLSDRALKDKDIQPMSLRQSVKAVCLMLEKLETVELVSSMDRVENIVYELSNNNKTTVQDNMDHREQLNLESLATKCSLIENLQDSLEMLVIAVKNLVNLYCKTFQTDFLLSSSRRETRDSQEIIFVSDNFIVHISTAHRLPVKWLKLYQGYTVECGVCYGGRNITPKINTPVKPLSNSGLSERVLWNEWLGFDSVQLFSLPRESRLSLTLRGIPASGSTSSDHPVNQGPVVLAGATIQLFSYKGHLVQGSQLIPMTTGTAADPLGPTSSAITSDSIFLQINLPDFGKFVIFSEPTMILPSIKKPFDSLSAEDQEIFAGVLEKDSATQCSDDELKLLWDKKEHLVANPAFLPRLLQAVPSWKSHCLPEIYSLLQLWEPIQPTQAFELLLPYYPDARVRDMAVECLQGLPTDQLIDYLPQLIEALKFDCYHNSPLAKMLLEKSCHSIQFAHKFFWLLKGAAQDNSCKHWFKLMFVALANVAGESLYEEFRKQEDLVKILSSMAEKLKTAKDKDLCLQQQLDILYKWFSKKGDIHLPFNPSWEVCGIDLKSSSYYTSNAFPLKLVFKNCNPEAEPVYIMFKVGDDLRQDMLTLQMIRIMDKLWQQENLDLKIITFACLSTGPKKGMVEIVTESETLRKIQVSYGLTGSFKERPLQEWLQKNNPTQLEYDKSLDNFLCSCAGYCVATYVLGICDRHNDNIMLKQSGHLFHIDFGKFLGDAQMFGSFKRDRVPFVLTSDMVYVINGGDKNCARFQRFVDLCCTAFNILRKSRNLFLNFFSLMSRSGIPGVSENAVTYIQQALLPGKSDAEAAAIFTRMIEDSSRSVFTQFNFFMHNLAQLKFSSHNEGALLSFVPKTYSIHTDGLITSIEVTDFQKRYTPEKHYTYSIRIMRQNVKVPSVVFRHFSEFVEFREKLMQRFPLVPWSPLSGKVVFGRSNVRTVAVNRKSEISNFVKEIFQHAPEISECDLVYTFFHPLIRDEQSSGLNINNGLHDTVNNARPANTGIQGEIKISIQYQKEHLQVMIMHARGLSLYGIDHPSPYVKLYMLPDPDKQTKQKTKVVKHTTHPTYNEVMQYKMSLEEVKTRTLQVTVWNHDVLKENQFMGATYIHLRKLDLTQENTEWRCLGNIQMSSTSHIS
ncbi:phosphatidylinositol 4-phosphate 3-kinase C2 domain-containing subunit alpha-like isoform X1 [Argonauta hians]